LTIYHSCLWQQDSPYEAFSASHMALAPSVHIATHFGQGISCSRKKLSITLKISELFCRLRPCSCLQNMNSSCISFWSTTTQTLKAEGHLTRLWINLIVVQNNLLSGVSRLVVPSHQLPIHQLKGGKSKGMPFSFFQVLLLPKHHFSHITSCWQY